MRSKTAEKSSWRKVPPRVVISIRARAKEKWPGDYEMQQFTIKGQKAAYLEVAFYRNLLLPRDVEAGIIASARRKWPQDYEMQAYTVRSQAEAYLGLDE